MARWRATCAVSLAVVAQAVPAGSHAEEPVRRRLEHLPAVTHTASVAPMPSDASRLFDTDQPYVTRERLDHGYTIVVVGVNGDNSLSAGLAPGLVNGGYRGAVEIVDWTTGHWPLFIYHLRAKNLHRGGAEQIGEKVAAYQARYPGRQINLVGYSAGAVVAVEAVEALPVDQGIDRLVLLAGAISPAHDLRPALKRTRLGVWSYFQPQDVVALWAGTLLAGTSDGAHLVSAGAIGFWPPVGASEADRELYRAKLVQQPFRPEMIASGNLGGHFQCVGERFVTMWVAPVLANENLSTTSRPRAERR